MAYSGVSDIFKIETARRFGERFRKDPLNKIAMNAVTRGKLDEIALNRDVLNDAFHSFSYEQEPAEITDQKRSGTCWIFAELNWLRTFAQTQHNMKNLALSFNYVVFWDKMEKANYFYELLIEHIDEEPDSRRLFFLLSNPTSDGGEWHMLQNVIDKYGLVPEDVMPETFNRENSRFMNEALSYYLRQGAAELKAMRMRGGSAEELRKKKDKLLEDVFRILAICLGLPPERFNWGFRDKNKNFHREEGITPLEFYDKYVGINPSDVYTIAHCPSSYTEYEKAYTVDFFNNMSDGVSWKWLNLPIRELKQHALKILKKGEACLFGCDVVHASHSKEGLLYDNVYDFDILFRTNFSMKKKTRIDFNQSVMTHAMVFSGVNLLNKKPDKWKVENSWGTKVGKKGYFVMSDKWFDEHVFAIMLKKEFLSPRILELFSQDPVVLPPWFPMA